MSYEMPKIILTLKVQLSLSLSLYLVLARTITKGATETDEK